MVLKINNNLITPSHIIEGEKVNDTYFEGKYHLMLPNSEEHYLTSVSERKQLLNESLRSNLYDRKTRGTIVNNTTSGKMFDVTETSEYVFEAKNFSNGCVLIYNTEKDTANNFDIAFYFITGSSLNTYERIFMDTETQENSKCCQFALWNGNFCFDVSGEDINKHVVIDTVKTNTKYAIRAKFENGIINTYYKQDNLLSNWIAKESFTPSSTVVFNTNTFCVGKRRQDNYSGCVFNGTIFLDKSYVIINNNNIFNPKEEVKNYSVYGTPTITKETITTRTATQKPFNQSVTINSSEIQEGTKYLVDYPGMFQIKTEDNTLAVKFLFEENPVWKYIKQEELVEGDNVLSLVSDTEKLKFIVNTTEHVLIDSTETEEVKTIKNFSTSNGFYFANLFPNYSSFKLITEVKTPSAQGDHSVIFAKRNDAENYFALRYGNIPSFYLGGWTQGTQDLEYNKYYWFCLNSENDSLVLYTLLDNKYSIESLPALTNWTRQCSVSNNFISGYNFALGYNTVTPGEYYKGEIVLSDTKIYIDENTYFDGKTAVQGVDYTVIGSPTIETETIHVDGEMPELTAGYLGYREGWKLKQGE